MRLAINGYGRIGRCLLRAASLRADCKQLDFIALNELADNASVAHLTRYDSTHGRFPGSVELDGTELLIAGEENRYNIKVLDGKAGHLPVWGELDVDLVVDCTGRYGAEADAVKHTSSTRRALLSYPGESSIPAIVMGVNQSNLEMSHRVVSGASCTSNALLPVLHVLHQAFGVKNGVVTTIHAAMHDQPVIDAYHSDDFRKNRAAYQSIIPVHTQLAQGVGRILPELDGRFIAHAVRVPVTNVSALNISLQLESDVDSAAVNQALAQSAESEMNGVLGYSCEELASCDFVTDSRSAIVDALQTQVVGGRTVNLLIWFDNEWAFANRMLDIARLMAAQT